LKLLYLNVRNVRILHTKWIVRWSVGKWGDPGWGGTTPGVQDPALFAGAKGAKGGGELTGVDGFEL
jgi:hypothetical protein